MAREPDTATLRHARSCIGCGRQAEKTALYRVVRCGTGDVFVDLSGKASGRGAYVCSLECLERAQKSRKLDRALRAHLSQDDYGRIYEGLALACADADREIAG